MGKEFRLVETKKVDEWHSLIDGKQDVEIHHFPEYLSLFEEHLDSKCFLFYYGDKEGSVFSPFFIDRIDHLPNMSERLGGTYQDLITPWYLSAPVIDGVVSKEDLLEFWKKVEDYCSKHRIVSGYCRLNPYTLKWTFA